MFCGLQLEFIGLANNAPLLVKEPLFQQFFFHSIVPFSPLHPLFSILHKIFYPHRKEFFYFSTAALVIAQLDSVKRNIFSSIFSPLCSPSNHPSQPISFFYFQPKSSVVKDGIKVKVEARKQHKNSVFFISPWPRSF